MMIILKALASTALTKPRTNGDKQISLPRKSKDSIFCSSTNLESVLQEVELAIILLDGRNSAKVLGRPDARVRPQRPDLAQLLVERIRILLIVSLIEEYKTF
jgi:hypothetical protein